MYARKLLAGVATAAVTLSAVALSAAPASAADPDDTTFTPTQADLIGVGSDTSQNAIKRIADAFNAQTPAPSFRIATFAATGGGTIPLPSGAVARPNGSGAGKALLYGAGNNPDVDFARSSSPQNSTETGAGLRSFPFALDTLVMAVSGSVASNAPPSLTPAQIVSIYKGETTDWSQLGGSPGAIAPKIPQTGSGTRSFFVAQLAAANGGAPVVLAPTVASVQEHDDTTIKNDPNAVAPFSQGRAGLLGGTLRLEGGFKADRALYNVVRGTDLGNPDVLAAFGSDGYACSTAARPLIEAAGFKQLATPLRGGACGAPTSDPTSNFTLNEAVVTTTSLAVTSPAPRQARLVATVTGSTPPSGSVSFFEGATTVAANVPMVSGQATVTVPATPGVHTYRAVYTPTTGSVFEPSEDTSSGLVRTSSTIAETFKSKNKFGKRARGSVIVTLAATAAKATGTVVVLRGNRVMGKGTLSAGKVRITLKKLRPGINRLKAVWGGDARAVGSLKKFKIKQLKRPNRN